MKPAARAVVGNLIWSADGGIWAVWRVEPFSYSSAGLAEKIEVHKRLRAMLLALPQDAMLMSIGERLDPTEVVARMADGINLERRIAWAEVCIASAHWLEQATMRRRRYYVVAALPRAKRAWHDALRSVGNELNAAFGLGPMPVSENELAQAERDAQELRQRLASHVRLHSVSAGEICWLYARALRRGLDEPFLGDSWEPEPIHDPSIVRNLRRSPSTAAPGEPRQHEVRRVLAHLTDVVVKEGGDKDDADRPRHRRYVRIDSGYGSSYQTVLAMADMPHRFWFPNGGGEWLHHAEHVGFPVDWCVRIRSVRNQDAQAKVRRKHRELLGQLEQYEGEVAGTPPQLAEAIKAIDETRAELSANPAESEFQVTVLLSIAAKSLAGLEEQAGALQAMFEPREYGLARPTGGQAALLRSMWPGTAPAAAVRDYTQFMLARDLSAGAPFCRDEVGDPRGLLLGIAMDGDETPVLFDPAHGPRVNASPSLSCVGRLGSGKSYFLKRLCWDTIARGGQVVTIDRSRAGEYTRFAEVTPGSSQVIRLDPGADVCFDPMRTFVGDERATISLGFLSLLAGCSMHSEEGAALAEAVDAVAEKPGSRLVQVLDELDRMGQDTEHDDAPARSLARRLAHYRRSASGQLAFGDGESLSLDADFIVFWAPSLSLPDKEVLSASGNGQDLLLPEQILGQALLYLVAAVGRKVVFNDPTRFAAALYDEAWALLASPHGRSLLIEGVRDGRKHNGAIWLASQHPNDVAVGELADLLGSRFIFDQASRAIPAALELLGASGNDAASVQLEAGLGTGQCLYRDLAGRLGIVQVLPPALANLDDSFSTTPTAVLSAAWDASRGKALDVPVDEPPPAIGQAEHPAAPLALEPPADQSVLPSGPPGGSPSIRRRRLRRNPVAEALSKEE